MIDTIFGNLTPQLLLMRIVAVILALTVHEFSHSLAAYKLGDRTSRYDKRLTLNPIHHIDPIGMVLIILVGFGWAKPVMVNPYNLRKPKRDMAIISFAGPLSNLIFGFITILAIVPYAYFWGITSQISAQLFHFLIILASLNISLAVFNMLPIPPLDGSKILALLLPNHLYYKFISFQYGMLILVVLIVTDLIDAILTPIVFAVYNVMFSIVVNIFSLFL